METQTRNMNLTSCKTEATVNSMAMTGAVTSINQAINIETNLAANLPQHDVQTNNEAQDHLCSQVESLAGLVDFSALKSSGSGVKNISNTIKMEQFDPHETQVFLPIPENVPKSRPVEHNGYKPLDDPCNDRKPVREPVKSNFSLTAETLTANNVSVLTGGWHFGEHDLLKESLEGFGIDLSEPHFDRMIPELEGVMPMTRFMKED